MNIRATGQDETTWILKISGRRPHVMTSFSEYVRHHKPEEQEPSGSLKDSAGAGSGLSGQAGLWDQAVQRCQTIQHITAGFKMLAGRAYVEHHNQAAGVVPRNVQSAGWKPQS